MQAESDSPEQEEVVCRICRLEAEPDNSLFHPCKCSGTIRFVHQDCLNQWLRHSGHTHCEVNKNCFDLTDSRTDDSNSASDGLVLAGVQAQILLHALVRT